MSKAAKPEFLANIAFMLASYNKIMNDLVNDMEITEDQADFLMEAATKGKGVEELTAIAKDFNKPIEGCGHCPGCMARKALMEGAPEDLKQFMHAMFGGKAIVIAVHKVEPGEEEVPGTTH